MSDKRTHPERLYDALLSEWNARQTVGLVIPPELEEMIRRHLRWACTMSAESVISDIRRRVELTPHMPQRSLTIRQIMEILRAADPDKSDSHLVSRPVEYKLKVKVDIID